MLLPARLIMVEKVGTCTLCTAMQWLQDHGSLQVHK